MKVIGKIEIFEDSDGDQLDFMIFTTNGGKYFNIGYNPKNVQAYGKTLDQEMLKFSEYCKKIKLK